MERPTGAERSDDPDDPMHGSINGYNNYGCRCRWCRAAQRQYERERRDPESVSRDVDEIALALYELRNP